MRSLLTSLGVIIGVGSVIVMVAMGEGSRRAIEEQISAMGTNLLQITHRPPPPHLRTAATRVSAFSRAELDKLKNESSYAAAISGVVRTPHISVFGSEGSAQIRVQGVEPDFLIIRSWKVAQGYFFDEDNLALRSTVAVLGQTTAKNLFGEAENALSQRIRIGTVYFNVIGIMEKKGADLSGEDQDDAVIIPMETAMIRITNSPFVNMIMMSIVDNKYMEAAQRETEIILREARRIPDSASPDFNIMNQSDMMDMASA